MAKNVYGSFFLSLGLTLAATCLPLPMERDRVAVPWKLLLMVGAAGSAVYCRVQIGSARRAERDELITYEAELAAHQETATVVAQVRAESAAEQQMIGQYGEPVALPPAEPSQPPSHQKQQVEPAATSTTQPVASPQGSKSQSDSSAPASQAQPAVQNNLLFERIRNHKKKHLMIPAETGSGKTSMLLGVVDYLLKVEPNTEFYFSTAKPGPFLGFEEKRAEDGQYHVIDLDMSNPSSVEGLIRRLNWLTKKMVARQKQRKKAEQSGAAYNPSRIVVVLDEWLATLELAKQYYDEIIREWQSEKPADRGVKPPNTEKELLRLVNNIGIMGREDNLCIWLFGQDHQVQNAGINSGLRKNFGIVVPFTMGCLETLEQALIGTAPIPPHAIGKQLYADAMVKLKAQPETRLVYSNLYGHELIPVPSLPDIKRKRLYSPKKVESIPKPWQVIALKKEGKDLAEAICKVYECPRGSVEFQRAKMEVMAAIS